MALDTHFGKSIFLHHGCRLQDETRIIRHPTQCLRQQEWYGRKRKSIGFQQVTSNQNTQRHHNSSNCHNSKLKFIAINYGGNTPTNLKEWLQILNYCSNKVALKHYSTTILQRYQLRDWLKKHTVLGPDFHAANQAISSDLGFLNKAQWPHSLRDRFITNKHGVANFTVVLNRKPFLSGLQLQQVSLRPPFPELIEDMLYISPSVTVSVSIMKTAPGKGGISFQQ